MKTNSEFPKSKFVRVSSSEFRSMVAADSLASEVPTKALAIVLGRQAGAQPFYQNEKHQEEKRHKAECPYCHGNNTEFLSEEYDYPDQDYSDAPTMWDAHRCNDCHKMFNVSA